MAVEVPDESFACLRAGRIARIGESAAQDSEMLAGAGLVGGDALGTSNYWFAAAVFAITLVISLVGLLFYKKICNRHEK